MALVNDYLELSEKYKQLCFKYKELKKEREELLLKIKELSTKKNKTCDAVTCENRFPEQKPVEVDSIIEETIIYEPPLFEVKSIDEPMENEPEDCGVVNVLENTDVKQKRGGRKKKNNVEENGEYTETES